MPNRKTDLERARLGEIPSMAAEGTSPQEGSVLTKIPTMSAFEGTFFGKPTLEFDPSEHLLAMGEEAGGLLSLAQLATSAGAKALKGTPMGDELNKRSQQLSDKLQELGPLMGGSAFPAITPLGRVGTRIGTAPAAQRSAQANRSVAEIMGRTHGMGPLPRPGRISPEGVFRPPLPATLGREAREFPKLRPASTARRALGMPRREANRARTVTFNPDQTRRFRDLFPDMSRAPSPRQSLTNAELFAMQAGEFDKRLGVIERLKKLNPEFGRRIIDQSTGFETTLERWLRSANQRQLDAYLSQVSRARAKKNLHLAKRPPDAVEAAATAFDKDPFDSPRLRKAFKNLRDATRKPPPKKPKR